MEGEEGMGPYGNLTLQDLHSDNPKSNPQRHTTEDTKEGGR